MPLASLLLGVLSLFAMIGGFLFAPVPDLGTVVSVLSPIFALFGVILGGIGHARVRQEGGDTGVALLGITLNAVLFFPSLCVASACSACNACFGAMDPAIPPFDDAATPPDKPPYDPPAFDDAGAALAPTYDAKDDASVAPDPAMPADPLAPEPPPPDVRPTDPRGAPPPAFPPPPMNALPPRRP